MNDQILTPGESFDIHFVWQIPEGDFIRAIFRARVITHISGSDRYLIELFDFRAGRQESEAGKIRNKTELNTTYWGLVGELIGRKAAIASEAVDGRPLRLILRTLTGDHRFFTQFDSLDSEALLRWARNQ